ncbi:MAG TPA: Jag N-terminal domain-containing protein, partial [Gemmatimonadales bacterium]|nr:Jag N-terminal domain-containing protein [Gemmatimonadales bacterium]
MTFREFTGKNVEEAIRSAMKEFGVDLSDLDIEILSQGSRGILGVGAEEARVLAAPRSAVAAAQSVRGSEPPATAARPAQTPAPAPAPAAEAEVEEMHTDEPAVAAAPSFETEERRPRTERPRRGGRNGREREERAGGRRERTPRAERPERGERADRPERTPAPS